MKYAIKSKNRCSKLKGMTYKLLKSFDVEDEDIFIFIPPSDYDGYNYEYPKCKCMIAPDGIVNTDNFIVNYFDDKEKYIYMNDDVSNIFMLDENNKKKALDKSDFLFLIKKLFSELEVNNLSYGGLYSCDNAMFMSGQKEMTNDLCFVTDPFSAVINNKEIILNKETNTNDNFKSDYEKSILHFRSKGGLVRLNHYCIKVVRNEKTSILNRNKETEIQQGEWMKWMYPNEISSIKHKPNGSTALRLRKIKCKYDM